MPTLRLHGGSRVTSRSPIRMRPAVGVPKPAIRRSSVVLPEPDGPRNAKNWPRSTSSEMSSSTGVAP